MLTTISLVIIIHANNHIFSYKDDYVLLHFCILCIAL